MCFLCLAPLIKRYASQHNRYLRLCCFLYIIETPFFQIVIEGVRGSSYFGDIAIDDVKLAVGACKQADPNKCTFEDPSICGWTQVNTSTVSLFLYEAK